MKTLSVVIALLLGFAELAVAQDSFFKGKTVRIVVPFAAGGGYDIYSRIMGRHMGKYIPGNPVFVVENMTGAGGLIGINLREDDNGEGDELIFVCTSEVEDAVRAEVRLRAS